MGSSSCKADSNLITKSKPLGIIVGEAKVGKTTLKDFCKLSHQKFLIFDTPSLDTLQKQEKDVLINALTEKPINTIFIMIEYENRFERIAENFLKVEGLFSQLTSNIVLVISHWEVSYNPEEEKKEIYQMLEGYCSRIIFFSNKKDPLKVIDEMYKHMLSMSQQQIIIDDYFFLNSYFKFSSRPSTIKRDSNKTLFTKRDNDEVSSQATIKTGAPTYFSRCFYWFYSSIRK